MAMSLAGESSASVISTRWAEPPWNCSSRTSEPTETASSTSAVSNCGVDTETSTPQLSLKSHWFLGWFDPGHDAGDGELLLRQQRDDEVVLVVTGGRDDDVDRGAVPAASSEETSQASAATQVTSRVGRRRSTRSGSCSKTSTSWPLACRSAAMAVPTLPAPAMATFTARPARSGQCCGPACSSSSPQGVVEHGEMQDVALLAHQLAGIEPRHAAPASPPPG